MSPLYIFFESLVLVTALSVDAFVASFAYGTNKIKIPLSSAAIISVICSAILAVAMLVGSILRPFIPPELTSIICFILLLTLGCIKLFDSLIKSYIRKNDKLHKKLSFSLFSLSFLLTIYADPETADQDESKSLTSREAAPLAIALSLDSLTVGFSAALASINGLQIVILSLLINLAAVITGCLVGRKISERSTISLAWLGGTLLILLAFLKL